MKKLLALLLLVPTPMLAQTRTIVSGYVAADAGIASDPVLVGVGVARETGPLGIRLGAAFDVTAPPPAMDDPAVPDPVSGIWSSDADGMLFLGNPWGRAPLVPYGLVGIGVRGVQAGGRLGVAANYSYGGGFRAPLGQTMALEGELRYRDAFAQAAVGPGSRVESGIDLRFGASYAFGGAPARRVTPLPMPGAPRSGFPAAGFPAASRGSADARERFAAAALFTAEQHIGVPYRWGGNTPAEGFDCSGFIRFVFQQHGLTVPRVSRDQARHGTPLPLDIGVLQPGDILAFASNGRDVDHTAIYAGNGRIIHSSSSGGGVRYDDLRTRRGEWYVRHMVAARRVLDESYAYR